MSQQKPPGEREERGVNGLTVCLESSEQRTSQTQDLSKFKFVSFQIEYISALDIQFAYRLRALRGIKWWTHLKSLFYRVWINDDKRRPITIK